MLNGLVWVVVVTCNGEVYNGLVDDGGDAHAEDCAECGGKGVDARLGKKIDCGSVGGFEGLDRILL
jgi:hypothetical protein